MFLACSRKSRHLLFEKLSRLFSYQALAACRREGNLGQKKTDGAKKQDKRVTEPKCETAKRSKIADQTASLSDRRKELRPSKYEGV